MSLESEGYLVVSSDDWEKHGYAGLYNGVPWDQEASERGFEDPLVFTELGKFDLLPTTDLAEQVLEAYAELRPRESMAIVFARLVEDHATPPLDRPGLQFLGYDLANLGRPFYSIVADRPRNPGPPMERLLNARNAHGLFISADTAREYRDAFLELEARDPVCDPGRLAVWEVYAVVHQPPP